MSRTDTWMPLYIGDYLADTMRLTTLQHGAYLLLLMEYWRQGPLPDEQPELAAIAKLDRKVWEREVWPTLSRFFERFDDGLLHQKRIDNERTKAIEISNKRREAVQQRADRKGNKSEDKSLESGYKEPTNVGSSEPTPSRDLHNYTSLRSEELPSVAARTSARGAGTRLPEDWAPDESGHRFAVELNLNPDHVLAAFRDYWIAKAGKDGRKTDWLATWRNWCRRESENRTKPGRSGGRPDPALSEDWQAIDRKFGLQTPGAFS